jgi:hypothetical protein
MSGSALNAFAPCGAMRLSSRQTYGERIYRQLIEEQQVSGTDAAFDSSWNSYNSCILYALAMGLQSAKLQNLHAAAQRDPRYVTEKLPELEHDYQLVPLITDTIEDRRAALQVAMRKREGNTQAAIIAGLTDIIPGGVSVITQNFDAAYLIGQTTLKTFDDFKTSVGYKAVVTTSAVTSLGAFTVSIAMQGGTGKRLSVGEKIVVDVTRNGLTEVVTVTDATDATLTATFANAHDAGAICTTQQWPAWVSPHRNYLIMVTDTSVLSNAAILRQINNFMDYTSRGSSTWVVVPDVSGESPAYTIETSRTGQHTIGLVAD